MQSSCVPNIGANALVLAGKNAGMVNEDSIKTSAGALLRLPIGRARTSINAIQELRSFGIHVYGTSIESGTEVYETELQLPGAFVFGSEGQGLHRDIIGECDQLIRIGQKGKSDSLNVSVSVGIVLYEISRQTS